MGAIESCKSDKYSEIYFKVDSTIFLSVTLKVAPPRMHLHANSCNADTYCNNGSKSIVNCLFESHIAVYIVLEGSILSNCHIIYYPHMITTTKGKSGVKNCVGSRKWITMCQSFPRVKVRGKNNVYSFLVSF